MSVSSLRSLPRARRRDQRERQLIDAAMECISARGLSDTTVQAVALEAGMAVGSISQYFDSKSRLLTAVLAHLAEEFEQHWQGMVGAAGEEPAARLATFVGSYFSAPLCQRRKVAVWFAFWGEVKAEPEYRAVCAEYDARHDRMLESLCADLIVAGGYRGRDARATSKLIASICHGLWLEFLTGQERLRRADLGRLASDGLAALFPGHAGAFTLVLCGAEKL